MNGNASWIHENLDLSNVVTGQIGSTPFRIEGRDSLRVRDAWSFGPGLQYIRNRFSLFGDVRVSTSSNWAVRGGAEFKIG